MAVASHTHFDHIGGHHEFAERWVHRAEADILARPDPGQHAGRALCVSDEAFDRPAAAALRLDRPTAPGRTRDATARGRRRASISATGSLEVVHTPGHSPGGIALFERATGILFSGDIVYDGPLIEDCPGADAADYRAQHAPAARPAGARHARRPLQELWRRAPPPAHHGLAAREGCLTPPGMTATAASGTARSIRLPTARCRIGRQVDDELQPGLVGLDERSRQWLPRNAAETSEPVPSAQLGSPAAAWKCSGRISRVAGPSGASTATRPKPVSTMPARAVALDQVAVAQEGGGEARRRPQIDPVRRALVLDPAARS